jgi:hypothetical protein
MTQRNALLLSTSTFLQYRAHPIIHTPSWNTGIYLQILFYLSYFIYNIMFFILRLYRNTNVTEFYITSWSRRLHTGIFYILHSMLSHAAQGNNKFH